MKVNLRKALKTDELAEAVEQEINELVDSKLSSLPPVPFKVGKNYMIRTITMANVGRIKNIVGKFIVMDGASWLADTGKWADCLRKENIFREVEPFKDEIYINMDAIVDATLYTLPLPTYKAA